MYSDNIKRSIREHGWTLERLAAEMTTTKNGVETKGITQATLSQMLNGNPTLSKIVQIADIIGVTPSELIADKQSSATLKCPHCGKDICITTL